MVYKILFSYYGQLLLLLLLCSHPVMSSSFATPWTTAHQAPLSMGFPGQEYWSELPFSSPGDLPELHLFRLLPTLASRFFTIIPTWESPKDESGLQLLGGKFCQDQHNCICA